MHAAVTASSHVRAAIESGKPVVALETTILSHGMPYPENVETALAVEAVVRENGAVPATMAIVGGTIRAGLSEDELERFGRERGVVKVSRADIAFALAQRLTGATTVAATMLCARLAGIRVFVTGGIGGVHRGGETSLDVSADLDELAKTPVCVVCAGAKALLDLPRTLEALETRGVPVIGYRTDTFPAFWSASSGLPLALRCDDPASVARLIDAQRSLGIETGTLVCVPVPAADEIPSGAMLGIIDRAVTESQQAGIKGKDVTPWLLRRIFELSGGASLAANIALIKNNARVAASIAAAL